MRNVFLVLLLPVLYIFFFSQRLNQPSGFSTPTAGTWQPELRDLAVRLMKHLCIQAPPHYTSDSSLSLFSSIPCWSPLCSSITGFGCEERLADFGFNWYQQAKWYVCNFGISGVMYCFRADFKVLKILRCQSISPADAVLRMGDKFKGKKVNKVF